MPRALARTEGVLQDDDQPSEAQKPIDFADEQPEPIEQNNSSSTASQQAQHVQSSQPDKEPGGSKWLILIIILLALVLLGGAVWYFMLREDSSSDNETGMNGEQLASLSEPEVPVPDLDLDQIIYAFGTSFESAADIYTRPAGGGDRESLFDLTKVTSVDFTTFSDPFGFVQSRKYAFVIDAKEVYVGSKTSEPGLIYTHPDGDPEQGTGVQSVIVSPDGSMLAFTAITTDTSTPQVWILSATAGSEPRLLVDEARIGPAQWSHDNSKLMFGPNILGAGAQLQTPYVMNIETGDETPIGDAESPYAYPVYAFSTDGTKVAYVMPTIDQDRATDDMVGYYVGKPYSIAWRDLISGEETIVATVEDDPMPRALAWEYSKDYFYFSIGNKLYDTSGLETGTEPLESAVYETTTAETIDVIYAANNLNVLAGSLQEDNTFIVYSIDIMATDRTEIMQTTDATTPIGILLR